MNRREFLHGIGRLALAGLASQMLPSRLFAQSTAKKKINVLMIAVDDLRPQLGCYGQKQMITPHMDQLASEGALFMSAYCQQAVCSPTRSSLLTGTRPDTTKVWDLKTHFRKALPDVVTLPQHFRNNGYHSIGIGKIYHGGYDDPPSWSEPWIPGKGKQYAKDAASKSTGDDEVQTSRPAAASKKAQTTKPAKKGPNGPPYECLDVPDNTYTDGITTDKAIEILHRIKDEPFFFAVGLIKPHLPFVAPKKYWDLYDESKIEIADNPFAPKGVAPMAMHTSGELRGYHGMPKNTDPFPEELQRKLIHGYYACCSYTDANVGRLLKALDDEGLRENTVVVLWGDHGWHLGEHGIWTKHTNFEHATRGCLMMRAPGKQNAAKVEGLTEFVDIYPTLCDLAGLDKPEHLEGTSFAPLLDDPARQWKKAAFSQFPRSYKGKSYMGYSMRTERYRYTEWKEKKGGKITDNLGGVELYDYQTDPEENTNLADDKKHAGVRKQLAAMLNAGWQGARPERNG